MHLESAGFLASCWNIFAVARSLAVRRSARSNLGLWIFLVAGLRGPDRHRITPYSLAVGVAFKIDYRRRHIFLANVPRQVSLAGGSSGSNASGAKALGLLFCPQALCLSGGTSNRCSSKLPTGQRLTARACSHISFHSPLAFKSWPQKY